MLFISSRQIFPIVGGDQIRTAQQLNYLSQKYDVDVVYQLIGNEDAKIRQFVPSVRKEVPFKMSKFKYYLQTLRFIFNKLPLQVNYYLNKSMKRYVDSCIKNYDIVFCNNIRTAEYAIEATNIIKVIDYVDAISMNYEKAKVRASGVKKIIYAIDYNRCKKYEQAVLRNFDKCATISEVDRDYILRNNHDKKISVVGNKVDLPAKACTCKHDVSDTLVFVGKMNYDPNVVAVTSFVDKIMPKLLVKHPHLKFKIVGAHPDNRVRQLESENVHVVGFVDSLEPFFQGATIVVAPMLTGAGIQNKILQAMSYGCCVVTTPIGAEGLIIKHNEIGVFSNADEMAEGINLLLGDRKKRVEMGDSARQYIIENMSDRNIAEQFWAFMGE